MGNHKETFFKICSYIGVGLVTFIVGFLSSDYVNFREYNRNVVKSDIEQLQSSSKAVQQQLALLSLTATGQKKKDPTDSAKLAETLRDLNDQVRELSVRLPQTKQDSETYSEAMVRLKKAADQMDGPLNAKEFVVATEDYFFKQQQFQNNLVAQQTKYNLITQ
jgi:hypothetical protein